MANARAWEDEYTLLCERCGYVVEGLPTEGPCPECGKPIAESLPERRTGSPWQRNPCPASIVRTWILTAQKPCRMLENIRIEEPTTWLRAWSVLASATILSIGLLVFLGIVLSADHGKFRDHWIIDSVAGAFVTGCFTLVLLYFLTFIEQVGIRTIARNRRFRLHNDTCVAVCSHGCTGWVIGTLLGSVSLIMLAPFEARPLVALGWYWYALPAIGMFAGFLFFETFAWLGLRRLKYANRVRPETAPASPAHAARD